LGLRSLSCPLTRDKFLYEELNAKGWILKKLNALELAAGVVLVPVNATFEFKEFLLRWKIEYEYVPILMGEFKREFGGL